MTCVPGAWRMPPRCSTICVLAGTVLAEFLTSEAYRRLD